MDSSSDMQQVPRSGRTWLANAGAATPRPNPCAGERSFGERPNATRHASSPVHDAAERREPARMQSMPTRRTFSLRRANSKRGGLFGCFLRIGGRWFPRLFGKGERFYPEFGEETRLSADQSWEAVGSGGPPSSVEDLSEDFLFVPTDKPIALK